MKSIENFLLNPPIWLCVLGIIISLLAASDAFKAHNWAWFAAELAIAVWWALDIKPRKREGIGGA